MRAFTIGLFAMLMALAAPARAQDLPKPGLPLGLEKFRWGMNITETTPHFRSIGERVPGPPDMGVLNHTLVFFAPYRWQGCTFVATLAFYDGKLDHVNLQMPEPSPDCARAVLVGLRNAFGAEHTDVSLPWPEPRLWKTAGGDVVYNYRVWLSAPGAVPIASLNETTIIPLR